MECSFADPASEAEWNDFYSKDKLPALISVPGFHTSQRFRALSHGCPVYLAIHSIDNPGILTSEEYRQKGGGNFARWQQHIADWHRNLYDGLARAPAIGADDCLALSAVGAAPLRKMGLDPASMYAIALEKVPEHRWLARINRAAQTVLGHVPEGVHLYAPMTEQLTSSADTAAGN
ncbi:hypothetical protein [Paludibacterium yongneupense]|uniref:hypothetical protein n=1 Tax=Paludibacterium yongneupense TaxID=400061 RepID=UPI001B7FA986|nr:hypothetical protein [Paludibacterium yongneupense]